jgi:hypothetical protein
MVRRSELAASLRSVADLQAIERELEVARKCDDNQARVRLITRAITLPEARPSTSRLAGAGWEQTLPN